MKALAATANPGWIEGFARFGLSAKGVVYCLTGILAFMAAFNFSSGSNGADKNAVFGFINDQPFGKVLLAIVALGLVCYCVWRLMQAVKDTEGKGGKAKGLMVRARYLFSGLVYGAIAFSTIRFVLTQRQQGSSNSSDQFAGELLSKPFGQWLVGLTGVVLIGVGIYQCYYALSGKYAKHVEGISGSKKNLLLRTGKAGYISRGIVWLIIGWLFVKAGLHSNAKEAGDTNDAFNWLQDSSYGSYLLAAVALGLICYGVFMFVRARYQPINTN